MICYHCGKGNIMGRTHTHHRGVAGGRWKKRAPKKQRVFQPNLQVMSIIIAGGKIKRVKLCTKCIKRVKKDVRDGKRPFLTFASTLGVKKDRVKVEEKKVPASAKATEGKEKKPRVKKTATKKVIS